MRFFSKKSPALSTVLSVSIELKEWVRFLTLYSQKRLTVAAVQFERGKDILVDILLTKRGRYSKHFLNISFLFLVASAIVAGPAIGAYYPTVPRSVAYENNGSVVELSTVSSTDLSTTTAVSDKPRFEIIDYEVVGGDTLASIADKFDISVDSIKWANSLKTEKLLPGQSLRIPPVTGIVYKVQAGDTIYSLAKKYKSEPQKIVNFPANDFSDLDTFALNIGQTLFIPDGVMPQSAPVYQPALVPQFIAGSGGKFIWPTQGVITQYPVSYHMALDIASNALPPVAAADSGVVSYAGCINWGYGCHVIINHPEGFQSLYAHLTSFNVSVGDNVGKGQIIGKMGNTGRSTGPHLHFEIRKNGITQNPLGYLK